MSADSASSLKSDEALLATARALPHSPYRDGYLDGMSRLLYGTRYISDTLHATLMEASRHDPENRKRGTLRERGYRDALERCIPNPNSCRQAAIGGRPLVNGIGKTCAISVRVSREHFLEFKKRGGVKWLREQLSKA